MIFSMNGDRQITVLDISHPGEVSYCMNKSIFINEYYCLLLLLITIAWGWGDPHITTLDGRLYTFNGWGEYTLVKVSLSQQNETFILQGRTQPVESSTATQFAAFAFGDPNGPFIQVSN